MNKIIYSLLFFVFLSSTLFSQIKGLVKDNKGLVVPNANIIVLDSVQEIETFAITNHVGEFLIADFLFFILTIQIKKHSFTRYDVEIIFD